MVNELKERKGKQKLAFSKEINLPEFLGKFLINGNKYIQDIENTPIKDDNNEIIGYGFLTKNYNLGVRINTFHYITNNFKETQKEFDKNNPKAIPRRPGYRVLEFIQQPNNIIKLKKPLSR